MTDINKLNLSKYDVISVEKLEDLDSTGLLLRHKKSGARIAIVSNDDNNKVFSIGFKTPPYNDTGLQHILEHSTLCGSRKYPVKDPFVELCKGSLNTFLNAMTYPDKTVYPVASCNDVDFKNIMDSFTKNEPQLVLLDIVLPFFNGFHWCQEIRKISKVPIIFLSSANDNMNIVMAMNMGGDEFIEKPFDLNVVTAKVQAVLRRTYEFRGTADVMEWNGAILNLADATVLYQDQKLELSKNEFKILQILLENTGKIVSRESIMTRLWDSNEFIDDNTLTVNVARLRKKMEQIGLGGKIITKKGIGYMVEA